MEIFMPRLSESNDEAVLTKWHFNELDMVGQGEDLLEVVTDKAAFDVPAPCGGRLTDIKKKEGDKVRTGELIAKIARS